MAYNRTKYVARCKEIVCAAASSGNKWVMHHIYFPWNCLRDGTKSKVASGMCNSEEIHARNFASVKKRWRVILTPTRYMATAIECNVTSRENILPVIWIPWLSDKWLLANFFILIWDPFTSNYVVLLWPNWRRTRDMYPVNHGCK